MSGSGGGGGYGYQADAFAFVSAYALAEQPLNWFEDVEDVPVAVSMETGGSGDDLGVELRGGGQIEIQCKHGAKKDQLFADAFLRAAKGLDNNPNLRAVIMVDSSSSGTVKDDLRSEIVRLGMGRTDNLKPISSEFLKLLEQNGIASNAALFNRLRIVVKDLENGMDGQAAATSLLARAVEPPSQSSTAWRILSNEGLELTTKRGRRDLRSLARLLGKHVTLSVKTNSHTLTAERYSRWVLESNESFWVPGLNVRLAINEAWDELLLDEALVSSSETETMAHQIRRYHEWERLAENARRDSDTCRAEGAVIGKGRLVISGGPSSGKSTLGRRLAASLTKQGALVLRVSLQRVARLLRNEVPFNVALLQVALDGSGISEESGRAALSSPDYLIADGLDECDPDRTDVANYLISWASGHPDCHICVLTRPVGHTASLLPNFSQAELLPLNDRTIDDYSEKLIAEKVGDKARGAALLSEFKRLVGYGRGEKRVASIAARNPLLLSFILCLFVEGKPLKDKRAELFEQIVELIHRSPMSDRPNRVDIDKTIAERVIEVTAWNLINTPEIDQKKLLDELGRDLEVQMGAPRLEARRLAEQGLRFWEERRLIERLTLGYVEAYTFVHLSLGEYLAGRYIGQMGDENLRRWVAATRREARWRQPILMACGAGAANRVVPLLLELDEPADPASTEAVLAAFAAAESEQIDKQIVEQVITRLRERLTSTIPLIAIEAGEGLRQIAPLALEVVDAITADFIDHEHEWTRLAGLTARFAAGKEYVTLEQTQRWLNDLRFVRRFHFKRESAESRTPALPDQAYELQEYSLLCAIEKIFTESPEPRQVVADTLERLRHGISSGTTFKLVPILGRYNAHDIAVKVFELDKPMASMLEFFRRMKTETSDGKLVEVALLEVIISATQGDKAEETTDQVLPADVDPSMSAFTNLSILISGLDFWETPYDHLQSINDRRKEAALKEVLRGTIIALSLSPVRIAQEAKLAVEKLPETKYGLLSELFRNIPSTPDWGRARDASLNCALIVDALSHSSLIIIVAAANLLEAGVGGDEARQLIRQALQNGSGFTLGAIAAIAPQLWDEKDSVEILLERLKGTPSPGFEHIYKALAKLAPSVGEAVRAEIREAILTGLHSDNPKNATGAADALLLLALANNPELIERLKTALEHWTERGSWCERCDAVVKDSSCSNCRHIPPNPRSTLIKVLTRFGELDTEELLHYCEDGWHDVPDVAYEALAERAGADPNLLKSLLARINKGLPPYESSTAINLLYRLLKLPAETLSAVEPDLLALTGSDVPAIRDVIISSLTAEWVTSEAAGRLATEALNDPSPGVRNSATKVLRLLYRG
jgi:hypothetical protein